MSWLKKLFARKEAPKVGDGVPVRPPPAAAARITTETIGTYVARLESEYRRTGNPELLARARFLRRKGE